MEGVPKLPKGYYFRVAESEGYYSGPTQLSLCVMKKNKWWFPWDEYVFGKKLDSTSPEHLLDKMEEMRDTLTLMLDKQAKRQALLGDYVSSD